MAAASNLYTKTAKVRRGPRAKKDDEVGLTFGTPTNSDLLCVIM
ncbi:hypothetical protein ANO14919_019670 [Xylariales sp. No.14919]|nr:hypothetical protein ANO14919_019670 [Xylariales sp. No.14919]